MSKKIYKETYFQHDRYARQDPKIKSLLVHFRKISEDKAKAAVCVFWWIIEDMHIDDYPINKLEAIADDYRCDIDFLKSILEDFDLFRIEDGCYVSGSIELRSYVELHIASNAILLALLIFMHYLCTSEYHACI